MKEISHSDVKSILNYVVKEQNYIWKFERSKKKGEEDKRAQENTGGDKARERTDTK